MKRYFFDTCGLVHCYAVSPFTTRVRRAVRGGLATAIHISELTLVEMPSALAKHCRKGGLGVKEFEAMELEFQREVAASAFTIEPLTNTQMRRAQHLLKYAGIVRKRDIGSADAIIAEACLDLSRSTTDEIVFYTHDWTLYSILRDINRFRAALELRYLGQGKGHIPTTTKRLRRV